MYFDVARQLITTAINNDEYRDRFGSLIDGTGRYAKNSVGSIMFHLWKTAFGQARPGEIRQAWCSAPGEIETRIQNAFKVFFL
jgi:hypothetical protein